MIAFRDIDRQPQPPTIRKFAISLILGFPLSGLLLSSLSWLIGGTLSLIPFYLLTSVAVLVFISSVSSRRLGRIFYVAWHTLAAWIEWLLSIFALILMFYGLLAPVALAIKLFRRKSPLANLDANRPSYWIDKKNDRDLASYFRQY